MPYLSRDTAPLIKRRMIKEKLSGARGGKIFPEERKKVRKKKERGGGK